ncbi:MAG TPA: M23 family metallopeptidase [Pyrinomonadaceae bacterium]|nr:M23 family metallopeptidase [Pyrinomonadaceae bacterium]
MRRPHLLLFSTLICMVLVILHQVIAAPDHLDLPAIYDNAEPPLEYGQTFIAQDRLMTGIRVYIGDPSRPGDPRVNELIGPADLVLYEASNLLQPMEISRSQVVPSGMTLAGLTSLLFNTPAATVVGNRYFFALSTSDSYGIGLRAQLVSTYPDGAEATRDPGTGVITENPLGRDLSFHVLSKLDYRLPFVGGPHDIRNAPDCPNHKPVGTVDYALPVNTNVIAAEAGEVIFRENDSRNCYGDQIVIKHSDGRKTRYAHLSQFLVDAGENVDRGQVIALSGNSTGTLPKCKPLGFHLHFEIIDESGQMNVALISNLPGTQWTAGSNAKKLCQPGNNSVDGMAVGPPSP